MHNLSDSPALKAFLHKCVVGQGFGARRCLLKRRYGFALIVSLTMMVFLLLLAISLSALLRIELQGVNVEAQQRQAKNNALLGLATAMANLQEMVGPDQRVTAAADIIARTDREGDIVVPSSGKRNVQDGMRYWTGVWGNSSDPTASVHNYSTEKRLLAWLVSGNEDRKVEAASSGAVVATSVSTAPAFEPDNQISPALTAGSNPQGVKFRIGGREAVLLVAAGTAGDAAESVANYVVAPTVPVSSLGGDGVDGSYAFWVGDEGIKARINMANVWPQEQNRTESLWAFSGAQRAAGEAMQGLDWLPTGANADGKILEQAIQAEQMLLLGGAIGPDKNTLGLRIHDFTLNSIGVLSDVRQGGLKRDLSRILEAETALEKNDDTIFPVVGSSSEPFYAMPPRWGLLRNFASFAQLSYDEPLKWQTPTSQRQGIHPVMMSAGISYRFMLSAPFVPTGGGATEKEQELTAYASPFVWLWNPYNRPLAGGSYEVGFQGPRKGLDGGVVQLTFIGTDALGAAIDRKVHFNLGSALFEDVPLLSNVSLNRKFLRFRVVLDRAIGPGETVCVRLQSNSDTYTEADNVLSLGSHMPLLNAFNYRVAVDSMRIPAVEEASIRIRMKSIGESTAYLRQNVGAGASADPGAALNPSTNNSYYQWIGRVEGNAVNDKNGDYSVDFDYYAVNMIDVSEGTYVEPIDLPELNVKIQIYHSLGYGAGYSSPLPTRWIANANPRAYMQNRTGFELANAVGSFDTFAIHPIYFGFISIPGDEQVRFIRARNDSTDGNLGEEIAFANDFNNSFTRSVRGGELPRRVYAPRPILFELPEQDIPLFSVADLRHAPLTAHVTAPAYAVGNSLADFRVAGSGADTTGLRSTSRNAPAGYQDPVGGSVWGPSAQRLYDHSYLLNASLWDRYFFSTVPANNSPLPATLPNSRMVLTASAQERPSVLRDAQGRQVASGLMLEGAFNVNSTSVEAWKAVLRGLDKLAYNPAMNIETGQALPYTTGFTLKNPFTRLRRPASGSGRFSFVSGQVPEHHTDYWHGYRSLTDADVEGLAERIVTEVRERGPFLSLAEFVNRSITDSGSDAQTIKRRRMLKGALQAAIDDEYTSNANSRINYVRDDTERLVYLGVNRRNQHGFDGFNTSEYNVAAYMGWNTTNRANRAPFSRNAAFAPGELNQSDVLAAIGASLAARSDTFVIRSYGDSINPVTGEVEGRAWCEALVQRFPEYMDGTNAAWDLPAEVSATNLRFGRRFRIISFRWLSADEI